MYNSLPKLFTLCLLSLRSFRRNFSSFSTARITESKKNVPLRVRVIKLVALIVGTALAATLTSCQSSTKKEEGKASQKVHLRGYFKRKPWKEGGFKEAHKMALARLSGKPTVIPMSSYSFTSTKDGKTYSGYVVGTSPFATPLTGSTTNVVIVPLKISIGSATFDAAAPDPCDSNVSALTRFQQSPLVNPVSALTMNMTNVGNVQFIDGFRRAEFWDTIHGSAAYQNVLNFSVLDSYELTAATIQNTDGNHGILIPGSDCASGGNTAQLALLSTDWLDGYLQGTVLPALTKSGKISPLDAVLFLFKNTVQSETDNPPSDQRCCILGYHSAVGAIAVQTYGTIDWDTSGIFGAGMSDASIASHEIGEWMDDPLASNATPPWGNIGQVTGCQANWEVGDPLSGTLMPPIMMNGKGYQMQELAFYSWFFNKTGNASVGAGGKFSSNGTFQAPAAACTP